MDLVCQVFDWIVTAAFLLFAFVVIFTPRARLHPIIAIALAWAFLMYALDDLFVQFGSTTIGGHDYSEYTTLLVPLFALIALVVLSFAPFLLEFVIVSLVIMMVCGWYNFDITLSVGLGTAVVIVMIIIGFLRLSYCMHVFVVALTVAAVISISVFAMLVQIDTFHPDVDLAPVCNDHINMLLVCDIRCSSILNDPNAIMHSFWVVLAAVLIVFRLLIVFGAASDIFEKEQPIPLCRGCPTACSRYRCCRSAKVVKQDPVILPPLQWFQTYEQLDQNQRYAQVQRQREQGQQYEMEQPAELEIDLELDLDPPRADMNDWIDLDELQLESQPIDEL